MNDIELNEALERIDELLELRYRSADLGNVDDPLAEAIYILLARQTREAVYRPVFATLRARFPRWVDVMNASVRDLERLLRPAGFQRQRARQLKALLRAVRKDNLNRGVGPAKNSRGDLTLSYLEGMTDAEAEDFLLRLPGIGVKSARCVMAYSLKRRRFAVDTHAHRIFTRLGLVTSLGRKRDHDPFEAAVPERMRKRLHMNLVHHGRSICTSQRPRCGDCVLVSFCEQGRPHAAKLQDGPVVLDLFAGAGGMGSGFKDMGYRIALAVEQNRHAAQTYRVNNPGVPVLERDVTSLDAKEIRKIIPGLLKIDVILAGPPCQGYSVAGARDPDDPRNQLFRHVGRIAQEVGAGLIVLENVLGIRNVRGTRFLHRILCSLRARGYAARAYLIRACDFGVPQNRRRYFILAGPRKVGSAPTFPNATHRAKGDLSKGNVPPAPDLIDALKGLPALSHGVEAEWHMLPKDQVLLNGSTMNHSRAVLRKIRKIKAGKGPISYRRLETDLANTLVAGHRALPVHPTLDRTISVREAARIQGFRDDYVFCGPRSQQPLQVANAVPPPLARALATHLLQFVVRSK